ncbi:MAG: NAD+ synthase [Bacteroidales bacterium]|nr:NAD+ synthase [Bacteroidales bacterium]
MKIALAQNNYHIGNFEANRKKIIKSIENARDQGADLVVFAELAVCGYPPQDFLEFDDFIYRCENAVQQIAEACKDIACIIGSPVRNTGPKGKPLFNAAVFCFQGETQVFRKALLPNYDVFDEYRYFEPARTFEILNFKNKKIALTICEDIWDVGNSRLYTVNPMEELIVHAPDLMINIAASPFNYGQPKRRLEVLRENVSLYKIPLIYVNHVGAQTEILFDGGSAAFAADGHVAISLPFFEESLKIVDSEELTTLKSTADKLVIPNKMELIHDALVMGVRDYFAKMGFKKAILGLSGGIDSALTMVLAARALGSENVYGLLMPSQFSSGHSVEDALALAKNLGSPYSIIEIKDLFNTFSESMKSHFEGRAFDVTEENIQARVRGVLLMAFCNKFGYILLNTSNKSEAAVGYGTLYGDMNGGLSVLGDVYKTEVFELAGYINRAQEIIPKNTIIKPPSAELRPNQKDSDSLPDYDLLDQILFQYIEVRKGPSELVAMGFDENLVNRVLKLVNTNEYKRHQTPPILRVSPKAFGMGRRMPIVAKYLS